MYDAGGWASLRTVSRNSIPPYFLLGLLPVMYEGGIELLI